MVPFYMGYVVDLQDAWAPYKAATTALKNVLDKRNVDEILARHAAAVPKLNAELDQLLTEGVLVEEYVLEHVRRLLNVVRECNFTIRWLLLHRTTSHKKYRDAIVAATPNPFDLLKLIMHAAQFEFHLKSSFKKLLDSKQQRWDHCKKESSERMTELASYYSGEKELSRQRKNESLQEYFTKMSSEIAALDYANSVMAGRKITQLVAALEEVQEFHQIDQSLQVKQFLQENREFMVKMLRTINVSPKVLGDLDIITDFSYAWDIVRDYTQLMHAKIKANPLTCLLLRSTFLKLASILSLPLVRITQACSADDVSVADYFSGELVAYVRVVLDIIPRSVFLILDDLIQLQTNSLKPIPTKLERRYLKDFAQLDHRYTLAKATHQVSVFTQGILAMKRTIMGIIKLDPRQLLEDGIRAELVRQLTTAMHTFLVFKTGQLSEFEARLAELGRKLDGFRQSFEYIQGQHTHSAASCTVCIPFVFSSVFSPLLPLPSFVPPTNPCRLHRCVRSEDLAGGVVAHHPLLRGAGVQLVPAEEGVRPSVAIPERRDPDPALRARAGAAGHRPERQGHVGQLHGTPDARDPRADRPTPHRLCRGHAGLVRPEADRGRRHPHLLAVAQRSVRHTSTGWALTHACGPLFSFFFILPFFPISVRVPSAVRVVFRWRSILALEAALRARAEHPSGGPARSLCPSLGRSEPMSPLLGIALEGPCVNMRTAHELPAIVPGRGTGGRRPHLLRCRTGSGRVRPPSFGPRPSG